MLTKLLWDVMVFDECEVLDEYGFLPFFILISTLISIFTLVIDIILLPLELIALIIYFIINRRNK